jgi:y4mF family transcriptional regulator
MENSLEKFIKEKRKTNKLKQVDLALKAGVGIRFIRDLEQGKKTLRIDKVGAVLKMFGYKLTPAKINKIK